MTRLVVWVVGEPGLGKTTLVRSLLGGMGAIQELVPRPKWTIAEQAVAVGHYTGAVFDGGDTLSYTGGAEALDYWAKNLFRYGLTLLDGDRLSNAKAVEFFRNRVHVPGLVCVHLSAPPEVGAGRRLARGSAQNAAWVRGRVTKAARFADTFPLEDQLELRGDMSEVELLLAARKFLRAASA